ncbi:MAG: NADP-dependent malic enzyme [Geminicoccaceae bacterium]
MVNFNQSDSTKISVTDDEALELHRRGKPGKIEIAPTKPLTTQRDLSLAYSPGVAAPCLAIQADPAKAYEYTAKGNVVAVISNGTAVLGLGNLGALGAKPVMEGKSVLFKRFADIDGIDLEVDSEDVDEFVNCVKLLGPTFGGINLEDIKAPGCFIIEQRLRELMDIPVFHDDQHGTAIIAAAGLLNALDVTGRKLEDAKLVINGAGAAAIACLDLLKAMGLPYGNAVLCDTKGVIHKGREIGMNQWKSAHAVETSARTLAEAIRGADAVFGLSVKGAFTADMIRSMADNPIVFAMANPDPEITPEEVAEIRPDAIVATGRSDYPNQINNVLGFPYIFRGALDVRASTINDEMKIAAARALADLAREEVPDEVTSVYGGRHLRYGPDYLIPTPFDPRLITHVPPAVAHAAELSGVARMPIKSKPAYVDKLRSRLDPTASRMQQIIDRVRANPKRMVFAEGEEESAIRAAIAWHNNGLGTPILIGREEAVTTVIDSMGVDIPDALEIHNARRSTGKTDYAERLYQRNQRHGMLFRDCQRQVNQDRNIFGACMVENGDADAMVTGLTRNAITVLDDIRKVIDPKEGDRVFGLTVMVAKGRTVLISDSLVHELPSTDELADITIQTAGFARRLGMTPRCALLSFSAFGSRQTEKTKRVQEAVQELDRRANESHKVDFEYEGELTAEIALDTELLDRYPFCRLSEPANVLIMPALHTANVSSQLLNQLGGGTVIGPLLLGLSKPVQILPMNASVSDILNLAALAADSAAQTADEQNGSNGDTDESIATAAE